MSLAGTRRSSRVIAAIILFASMWQLPHRAQDDLVCDPAAAEAHDESKHVFTGGGAADHQDHCAICHWLRSIKHGFPVHAAADVPAGAGCRLTAAASGSLRDPGADRLPARAPPSDLD